MTLTADLAFNEMGLERARKTDEIGVESLIMRRTVSSLDHTAEYRSDLVDAIGSTLLCRAFFFFDTGHFGIVPEWAQVGDLVCIIFGCQIPLVLRREESHYRLIGEW